jgi:hypothetical protein
MNFSIVDDATWVVAIPLALTLVWHLFRMTRMTEARSDIRKTVRR